MSEQETEHVDVTILGGGITGLTLALQLKRAEPELSIVVLERLRHPAPEATHKVGESSVEVQAHYLRDVLGLTEHLDNDQLRKNGLRMFFPAAGNTDIARRVEYGQNDEAPLPSYQLDRGRLENHLGERVAALGVRFEQGAQVSSVDLREDGSDHTVEFRQDRTGRRIASRWVVDATGRTGLLKRKLDLAKPVDHRANAVWFRIEHEIDIHQWSAEPQWRARVEDWMRRLSTNHLMGHGYWVWLIPLASGSTSVGIVADATIHPIEGFNTLDRALEWFRTWEPQCGDTVADLRDRVQDFRVMRDYAYGCKQVYSAHRWALTGEAGVSIDPLYSSGGDLMAISNGLITDLITRDRAGEDISTLAVAHNQVYLVFAEIWLVAYAGLFRIMGNPQAMVAKVIWDTVIYWAVPGLLAFHDAIRRLAASPSAFLSLQRTWTVHARVQAFLLEWHDVAEVSASDIFADPYTLLTWLRPLHEDMAAGLPDPELDARLASNVAFLEQLAGQLFSRAIEGLRADGLGEHEQIAAWSADPLVTDLIAAYRQRDPGNPVDERWTTLGRFGAHEEVRA
ncbi:NAD(P)/FAD-dependent oxidoreductase [Nocardia rhizosphaerae]|uniref:NAD(P)/FAD-dependent oxidoreductase n=1 Tax=Nocardia rhizosphaerae TaxID=1691571 RepID=A0ABV8LAS2_9NOCA